MSVTDYVLSVIRTWVPILVGTVGGWLAAHGLNLDPSVAIGATAALAGIASGVYYAVVRALELKFPFLGALLGHTAKPTYAKLMTRPGRSSF
jgi:uncharacterized protein (DUF697 family)